MFERDYILKMIEQLGRALARIAARKRAGQLDEAEQELRETGESLLGLRPDVLLAMPEEEVVGLLSTREGPDVGRLAVLIRVWIEHADLCERHDKKGAALSRRLRALGLVTRLERIGARDVLSPHQEAIDALVTALAEEDLLPEGPLALFAYEHARGNFAKAEDWLYAARSRGADCTDEGLASYDSLLALPDDVLERGGLPRDEVLEGRARFAR